MLAQLRAGVELFRAGRYSEAAQRFDSSGKAAMAAGADELAVRFLGNLGGCQFSLHQYQPALKSYRDAQALAKFLGNRSAAAALDFNIASVYSEMGELESAAQWTRSALEQISTADRRQQMPKLLIQMATLRARQDRMAEALPMFGEGIASANQAGDVELAAIGWNRAGEEFLKRGDLAAAEPALLEAYRVRRLNHLALDSSYRNLGRLRLEQGDLISASALLDRAVELSSRPQGPIPSWDVYHYRGRVRLAQGRLRDALDDLRISRRLAREWRWSIPPEDAARVGAEGWLETVHSALVEAGNRLYQRTRDPALIRETFEAAEENRANSLRALFSDRRASAAATLPVRYWEALANLQHAEVEALRGKDPRSDENLSAARAELVRMEASQSAISTRLAAGLLRRTQAAMNADSALFSFQLGDSISWMWALDREGLVLYPLPPRKLIELRVQAAARAIRDDSPQATEISAVLYRTLFGRLGPRFQQKTRWLLALDQGMFEAPIAALVENTGPRLAYVAEHHVTQLIPGAGYWLESKARRDTVTESAQSSTLFVGIGDPIYNVADRRLPEVQQRAGWGAGRGAGWVAGWRAEWAWPLEVFAAPKSSNPLILPRLVGSGSELDACTRAWSGEHILLKGRDASRQRLAEALHHNPAVIHLATHVVQSSDRPPTGLIALSLKEDREMELVPAVEIASWTIHGGLVVLSGCHSSAGADLPGTGLVGLARAWLMAGAQAVIGSNWDILDESGALFSSLYTNLKRRHDADFGGALRAAQVEMIRSGGWRARPRYWGAYSLVGNQ